LYSVNPVTNYDVEMVAELLQLFPPAPPAWVEAAQEIPLARRRFDRLVENALASLHERDAQIADLEAALSGAGYEPEPELVEAVRARLEDRRGPHS
jgi:hypothetical protein